MQIYETFCNYRSIVTTFLDKLRQKPSLRLIAICHLCEVKMRLKKGMKCTYQIACATT